MSGSTFEPWTYPSALYYRIPVPKNAPNHSLDLTSVLHHALREDRLKRESALDHPWRTRKGIASSGGVGEGEAVSFPLAKAAAFARVGKAARDEARANEAQSEWQRKRAASHSVGRFAASRRSGSGGAGGGTSNSWMLEPTTADVPETHAGAEGPAAEDCEGGACFGFDPAATLRSTGSRGSVTTAAASFDGKASADAPSALRHSVPYTAWGNADKRFGGGSSSSSSSSCGSSGSGNTKGHLFRKGHGTSKDAGFVRNFMKDPYDTAEKASAVAVAAAAAAGSGCRSRPHSTGAKGAAKKMDTKAQELRAATTGLAMAERAVRAARAQVEMLDREQALLAPADGGANMRRKAVVAAIVYNEKLIVLCAAQAALDALSTDGGRLSDRDELLREDRGMGGAAAAAEREEDGRRRHGMMAIGQALSEQVEELLEDLQLACTVQPAHSLGGLATEQHAETVAVLRDLAIALRAALDRLLELDSINADWAHVASLAVRLAAVATRAEQSLFYFDERLRFQTTQHRFVRQSEHLRQERRGGKGNYRVLHTGTLPKALKARRNQFSGRGRGVGGGGGGEEGGLASGIPLDKDGKPKFKSRIDMYFQQINPEVLHADREKQRFGQMTRRQRENAALRSMTALATAQGDGGRQRWTQHGEGALKGAGRMNAASERVLRTFISDMTNTYETNWNVSDFTGEGQANKQTT